MHSVLLVDDEPEVLRLVETVLTREGYKVLSASTGDKALDKLRKSGFQPDLLLTDVVMPGMSGPMLADQLRAQFPHVSVLYISAFEDRQVVRRYVKEPGFSFIPKPFQIEDLTSRVKELLAR